MSFLRHWPGTEADGSSRRMWAELLGVALVSGVAVALILWRTDLNTIGTAAFADPGWDRHLYREMARRDLFDFKIAPYCWRILVPWLAKAQPWPLQAGFMTVTVAALIATGPLVYLLVRAAGGSRAATLSMVFAFFSLGWAARYSAQDFWVPDATSMALTVAVMWLVVAKRWWAAGAVMTVGVLAKESVVFVAPLAFTWHARTWRDWPALRRAVLIGAPAVLALLLLRTFIAPENGNSTYIATMPPEISRFPELFGQYDYSQRFRDIAIDERWAHRDWDDLRRYFVDPFGLPLLVVAGAGALADPKRALRLSPFLVLVYSQLLFATDTQRLLVLAFPVLAVLGGGGIAQLAKRLRVSEAAFVTAFVGVFLASLVDANDLGADLVPEAVILVAALAAAAFWAARPCAQPKG